MECPRCAAEMPKGKDGPWCTECEKQYDTWIRRHATDILWQTGIGALVAMAIGLGLPLLGLDSVIATAGVMAGFATFMGLRAWGKKRRRKQFLAGALPRAYLPSRTT
jgi:hypothetical protein